MSKEKIHCHIITVGLTVLRNYCQSNDLDFRQLDYSKLRSDKNFLSALVKNIEKDPKKASAELNSLFSYSEKYNVPIDEVYLISTDTDECEIATKALEKYLRETYKIQVNIKRVRGYNTKKEGTFYYGLIELLHTLAEKINKWKGRVIYFNATGGFKPEVALMVTLGSIYGIPTYYRHEIVGDVVEIPPFPLLLSREKMEILKRFTELPSGRKPAEILDIETAKQLEEAHLIRPIYDSEGILQKYEITELGKTLLSLQEKLK